jgi:hypothetical protein
MDVQTGCDPFQNLVGRDLADAFGDFSSAVGRDANKSRNPAV